MVNNVAAHKIQKPRPSKDQMRIRAGLIMSGHTARSFAKTHGVSTGLISRLISGHRPGTRGKSAKLRRILEQLSA